MGVGEEGWFPVCLLSTVKGKKATQKSLQNEYTEVLYQYYHGIVPIYSCFGGCQMSDQGTPFNFTKVVSKKKKKKSAVQSTLMFSDTKTQGIESLISNSSVHGE